MQRRQLYWHCGVIIVAWLLFILPAACSCMLTHAAHVHNPHCFCMQPYWDKSCLACSELSMGWNSIISNIYDFSFVCFPIYSLYTVYCWYTVGTAVHNFSYTCIDCTIIETHPFVIVQVRMLIGLIRKVTGVTISAFFKQKSGYRYSGRKMEMPWHSRSGFGHDIRKYRMRSAALPITTQQSF